ncbi:MAG TPA: hypothetical protein PLO56_09515 [Rhodothermales bacterium]|nr:hypothetical protein [Rhodothermales bacterium]
MKKLFTVLFFLGLTISFSHIYAQEVVKFSKGKSEKTIAVTLSKNASKTYSIEVRGGQAIIVAALGNQAENIAITLQNPSAASDHETEPGGLRVLANDSGKYLIRVANTGNSTKTFNIRFFAGNGKHY